MSQQPGGLPPTNSGSPAATDTDDADRGLEARLMRDEERLTADEARLAAHEQRLTTDEQRLADDEQRLAADEATAHTTRVMSLGGVALAGVLVIAVAALVIAILALRQDVRAIENAAPDGSVGTAAIQESAVTAGKLAPGSVGVAPLQRGAVTRAAIAASAVGPGQLAERTVRRRHVAGEALTGAQIREQTLARVPAAARSRTARTAGNARALGGAEAAAYLSAVRTVEQSSAFGPARIKGPVAPRCRAGARVVSGGAAVEGAVRGVAVVTSAPTDRGWSALAQRVTGPPGSWRLVVTAICANGGS